MNSGTIHWAILGTKARTIKQGSSFNKDNASLISSGVLSSRRLNTAGQSTGAMPAILKGLLAKAVSSGGSAALKAFADAAKTSLNKTVAKNRLKGK